MVKKTVKRKSGTRMKHDCERCATNDMVLKVMFIILGVAVIVAAYYIGYIIGSG